MATKDNDKADEVSDFKFAVGEKDDMVLLILQGKISHREIPILEEIETQLKEKPQTVVILNFKDIAVFMPGAHAFLANFLKHLRDAHKILGLCAMRPEIKTSLTAAGLIRVNEMFDSIPLAWNCLKTKLEEQKDETPEEESKAA